MDYLKVAKIQSDADWATIKNRAYQDWGLAYYWAIASSVNVYIPQTWLATVSLANCYRITANKSMCNV